MTQTIDVQLDDPIAIARDERARVRDAFMQARDALLEIVRQRDGKGGTRIIDEVAAKEGLPAATVQQALWALLNERVLASDERGNVTKPVTA